MSEAPQRTAPLRAVVREVRGLRVRVLEGGAGPLVVLLPSMLVRAETYAPLLRRLAARFSVMAVELPGSGGSARVEAPWSFEDYAAFARDLLRDLGDPAPVVVGHSDSGPVALRLASGDTPACGRAVLVDTSGVRRRGGLARIVLGRALDAVLEARLTVRAGWHVLFNLLRHPRSFLYQVRASAGDDALRRAADVRAPTLITWGLRDHTMPLAGGRALAQAAGARFVVVPGSHDWLILKPERFVRALERFLADSG